MKTAWPHRMIRTILMTSVSMAWGLSSPAGAALPDPTRPPPGMAPNPGTGTGVVMGITAPLSPIAPRMPPSVMPAPTPRTAVVTPRVQALHHPIDALPGSASALIDGRLLRVGDRLGDAMVQDIRPDGVWLRLSRGGTQWLALFAPVEAPAAATADTTANATPAPESATGRLPARKEP